MGLIKDIIIFILMMVMLLNFKQHLD